MDNENKTTNPQEGEREEEKQELPSASQEGGEQDEESSEVASSEENAPDRPDITYNNA